MTPESWKTERLFELRARIQIEAAILRSLRTELAELKRLEGEELRLRYGWESPEAVAETMRERRDYLNELESAWLAGEHNLKNWSPNVPTEAPRINISKTPPVTVAVLAVYMILSLAHNNVVM